MKTYTFITILSVFLIFSVFVFGAMFIPNEKPPLFIIIALVCVIVNVGVWASIMITKHLEL